MRYYTTTLLSALLISLNTYASGGSSGGDLGEDDAVDARTPLSMPGLAKAWAALSESFPKASAASVDEASDTGASSKIARGFSKALASGRDEEGTVPLDDAGYEHYPTIKIFLTKPQTGFVGVLPKFLSGNREAFKGLSEKEKDVVSGIITIIESSGDNFTSKSSPSIVKPE